MIRESHTTNKIITPSLVQLPGKICWLEFSIMLIICCKNKDLCEFLHRFLVLILMQIPVKSVTHIYTWGCKNIIFDFVVVLQQLL